MQRIAKKEAQLTVVLHVYIQKTCIHIFISFLLSVLKHPLSHPPASALFFKVSFDDHGHLMHFDHTKTLNLIVQYLILL